MVMIMRPKITDVEWAGRKSGTTGGGTKRGRQMARRGFMANTMAINIIQWELAEPE
jgi:hypothetical protein